MRRLRHRVPWASSCSTPCHSHPRSIRLILKEICTFSPILFPSPSNIPTVLACSYYNQNENNANLSPQQQQPHTGRPRCLLSCQHHPHTDRPLQPFGDRRPHPRPQRRLKRPRWRRRRREEGRQGRQEAAAAEESGSRTQGVDCFYKKAGKGKTGTKEGEEEEEEAAAEAAAEEEYRSSQLACGKTCRSFFFSLRLLTFPFSRSCT